MNSDRYYFGIIIRVILILISSLLLSFTAFKTNYLYSLLTLLVISVLQTWELIRYILNRRNDIKRMLEYIRENNPTMYFSQSRVYPFNELGDFLNEVGNIVREVRIEKEKQLQYMQYIVQHVGIGLISFDKEGSVDVINQSARDILGLPEINSINILDKVQDGLSETLKTLRSSEQKVITLLSGNRIQQVAIRISVFKIGLKEIRLASFQDIKNELDEKEMDSWQKLIRVLTHEIINSVTPVTSLTTTISGFFKKGDRIIAAKDLSNKDIEEALTGLGYIEERGKNLINFVTKFRSLTRLPEPKFEQVRLSDIFDRVAILKKEDLARKNITLKYSTSPPDLIQFCDRSLIEHVLLNLINNSSDAVENNDDSKGKNINIKGILGEDKRISISVIDNGTGIEGELMKNIFIPFFTTKDQGSGIGLSLSRQIMKLHKGTISVISKPGIETEFILNF